MNAIERRIAALEVHDSNLNRGPVQIELGCSDDLII